MDNCDLKVYALWVKGLHKEKINQRFVCVAMCAEQAVKMAESIAIEHGWSNVEIDQFNCLGDIDMFPWSNEESEDKKCQS
ncbi:MAG TPA: hypothetical protein DIU00_03315 [Phycisphaerales bacterium]|nr:hypothetical protein [Phycisphaerales bacterium]